MLTRIDINRDNPAAVHIGDTSTDLCATITGPQANVNPGIRPSSTGTLVSNIVLDTSSQSSDTIDYVATDSASVTSTSTRTVLVEAAASAATSSTPHSGAT